MKRWMNFLRGMVTLRLEGQFPERVINLCAQEGVEFWGVEWLDDHTVRLTARRFHLKRLEALARRVDCTVEREDSRGLPDFVLRFRRRYAFLIGLTVALCAVGVLSRFVLTIEVTGNQQVPTAVILSQLRQLGVRPGVYGPSIDRKQVAEEVVLALDELAWMAMNLHGTRLEVSVRERIPAPERVSEAGYYHIVAEAGGVILHVEAELGDAVVQEGDIVAVGETLISGLVTLEPPLYSDLPNRYYQIHARGRVWARTWRTVTAVIPVETAVKTSLGGEDNLWSLDLMGRRVEIFGNSSISHPVYDKITTVRPLTLPGGVTLPLSLQTERYRAWELETTEVDLTAAQSLLEEQLVRRLAVLLGEDGEVESVDFTSRVEGGLLRVTAQAQCWEEIGIEIPGEEPGAMTVESGEDPSP